MQGSKSDSFVKASKKQRRFDDGVTKQGNPKKGKYTKNKPNEKHQYPH
jgi:hypothetical protein